MKALFALLSACSLMACSHSSSNSGGGGGLPPISDKAAHGTLNGKSADFSVGSYSHYADNKGVDHVTITLTPNGVDACNGLAADGSIFIDAPAALGTYGFPQAAVIFYYVKDGVSQNDMSSNEAVKIISDDGTKLTGSVSSMANGSNINGTFAVTVCGAPGPGPGPGPGPAPGPTGPLDPAQVPAVVATSWSEVKYAFCSAQGSYGVLIDFQGTDLSQQTTGNFKMGVRGCDGSRPFQWDTVSTFNLSKGKNGVTLDFGPSKVISGQENTIETFGNMFTNAYGVMHGNSGPCTLLVNEATQGLYDQDPNDSCK